MDCHMSGTEDLPEPMPPYHQLGPQEFQWNFNKNAKFSFNKMHMKMLCMEISFMPQYVKGIDSCKLREVVV